MLTRRRILALGTGLAATALLSACGATTPIRPAVAISDLSLTEIRQALIQAGDERGWVVSAMPQANQLQATFVKDYHCCVVDIIYNESTFTISLNDNTSKSLLNPDGSVHRKVNQWINNYRHDAQTIMTQMRIKKRNQATLGKLW